jgi:hypothetical protein
MTYRINNWLQPKQVIGLQSTESLLNLSHFDIHPNHSNSAAINQLINHYQLPHEPKFLHQVHGNHVVEYEETPKDQLIIKADACFTRTPDVICAVMTADCLPVLITDTAGSFVAAVHCGWRSLYSNILAKTIQAIQPKHDVLVWFGPCIQVKQYEVDQSFVINYLNHHPDAASAFTPVINSKSHANLNRMAQIQLHKLGITQIVMNNECTYLDDRYYSWRQNKTIKRMASMTWITP